MSLKVTDPVLYGLIDEETHRQNDSLEMIASENFTSESVMECLGSVLTNKYSEGYVGKRYYGGNKVIDKIEGLCISRTLNAFSLDNNDWGVNVQPYSGSIANLAVYNALLEPGDKIMGMGLTSGGHLTHGFYTDKKKISVSSIYYNSLQYHIKDDGYIDYDKLEQEVKSFKPKLIIYGGSAYPRDFDHERFRMIANSVNSYLMCDMAHNAGLIAAGELISPFAHSDIVTTTTHKTLRGPRAGMIFFKKEFEKKINESVFPGIQGGPHQNQIAAICRQMEEVSTPEYKEYIRNVTLNAKTFANELTSMGFKLVTGGTDTHQVLIDLKGFGINGSKVEKVADLVGITINKNTVFGDKSALSPSGVRIGTPALTTRGMKENEFKEIAYIFDKVVKLGISAQDNNGKMPLKDFTNNLNMNFTQDINDIKNDIGNITARFPLHKPKFPQILPVIQQKASTNKIYAPLNFMKGFKFIRKLL